MAGVPAYIKPLSYIRGSGSQYITTDIYLRSTDTVKSKWRFEGQAGNTYGCYTSGGADDNFCLYAGSQSVNAYIRYNGQVVREFKPPTGTIHELEQGPDGFFDDGVRLVSFSQATFTCSAPMYIFMLPNSTSAKVTARCYGLTVYRDGEQVCNFIPARNELTGEVGFWESVGGVFYENAGTGSFSAGPEVNFSVKTLLLKRRMALLGTVDYQVRLPEGFTKYDWLEAQGAYINLLRSFPGGYKFKARLKMTSSTGSSQLLFGSESVEPGSSIVSRSLIGWSSNPGNLYIGCGSYTNVASSFVVGQYYDYEGVIKSGESYISLNRQVEATYSGTFSNNTFNNVYLFCDNVRGNARHYSNVRIHGDIKIYDAAETLSFRLFPCTNQNGDPGYYDAISQSFFPKTGGNGTITVGFD